MRPIDIEDVVRERYARGAQAREESLCCPTSYSPQLLEILPAEILERDYGCGDPSPYLRPGQTVLDLGSGAGKLCYIAAQIVGPSGRVLGVDFNGEMLGLARRYQASIAARLGYDNVSFLHGRIQDLRTDLDAVDRYLTEHCIGGLAALDAFQRFVDGSRAEQPLVADDSVDVVVSNCVLNLARDEDKPVLFEEIFRVLRRGGRAVISDIVADEPVPPHLKADPDLWSGCISGALQESELLDAFARAGFHGIEIVERSDAPWRVVSGLEFRSLTVSAWKGKQGECWDHNHAVIYRGPWSEVRDDDGHVLRRGVRTAVCEKTFRLYTQAPYSEHVLPVEPRVPVRPEAAKPFDCARDAVRDPRESKGIDYDATTPVVACAIKGCC